MRSPLTPFLSPPGRGGWMWRWPHVLLTPAAGQRKSCGTSDRVPFVVRSLRVSRADRNGRAWGDLVLRRGRTLLNRRIVQLERIPAASLDLHSPPSSTERVEPALIGRS